MEGGNEGMDGGKREVEMQLEEQSVKEGEQWEAEKEMLCRRVRELELKQQERRGKGGDATW